MHEKHSKPSEATSPMITLENWHKQVPNPFDTGFTTYRLGDIRRLAKALAKGLNKGLWTPTQVAQRFGSRLVDGEIYLGSGETQQGGTFEVLLHKHSTVWKSDVGHNPHPRKGR